MIKSPRIKDADKYIVQEEKHLTVEIGLWCARAYKEGHRTAVEVLHSHEQAQADPMNPPKLARYSRALQALFEEKPWKDGMKGFKNKAPLASEAEHIALAMKMKEDLKNKPIFE